MKWHHLWVWKYIFVLFVCLEWRQKGGSIPVGPGRINISFFFIYFLQFSYLYIGYGLHLPSLRNIFLNECICDGWFRVSTWLGLGAQIFGQTFFWMFLWRWLNEVNTEIGGLRLKHITFHNVDLPHPISWRPDWNKDWPPLSETKFCQYTTSGLKLATLPWVSSVSA